MLSVSFKDYEFMEEPPLL